MKKQPGFIPGSLARSSNLDNENDQETINFIFNTPVSRRIFDNISANTGFSGDATEHKKSNVLRIRSQKLLEEKIVGKLPTLYVGSGLDFEYPISLGVRNLVMIDPIFTEQENIKRLQDKIRNTEGLVLLEMSDSEIGFILDEKEIKITIAPNIYSSKKPPEPPKQLSPEEEKMFLRLEQKRLERQKERQARGCFEEGVVEKEPKKIISRFQPPDKIGMILGFRAMMTKADTDEESLNNLVNGGYILFDEDIDDKHQSQFERLKFNEDSEYVDTDYLLVKKSD